MNAFPFKILILSVSSFLGQNILDVLEPRRHALRVIGLSSEAHHVNTRRCDQFQLVSPIANRERFNQEFQSCLDLEQPDLILPGRDDDVVFLAEFRELHPQYAPAIPSGPSALAQMVRDKYLTALWAQEQGLPFAESCVYAGPQDQQRLDDFVSRVGFPVLAKPRKGFASQGVYLACDRHQLNNLCTVSDLIFQEYLDPPSDLVEKIALYQLGIPLNFEIPEERHYTAQTLITPDGQVAEIFCSISRMRFGRDEWYEHIELPALSALMQRYAEALSQEGWRGPVNLQAKRDTQGVWKAYELNLRFSGGTSCRFQLGYDELGRLFRYFYPSSGLADFSRVPPLAVVQRTLHDHLLPLEPKL